MEKKVTTLNQSSTINLDFLFNLNLNYTKLTLYNLYIILFCFK